jgi:DNA-binding NarL/FixJ family response regulator
MAAKTTVLVVDDEPHLRRFVRILLHSTFEDLEVIEAGDETAALARYAEAKPDLVLLDINLIGCSGIAVLQQLRQMDPQAEVVMLTAVNVRHTIEEAQAAGAAGYILKEVDEAELTTALLEIVRARFGVAETEGPTP